MALSPSEKAKVIQAISLFTLTPGKQQQLHLEQQQEKRRQQQQQPQPTNVPAKPRSVMKRNYVLMPHPLYAPNSSSGDGLRAVFISGPQPNSKRYLTALTHELQPLLNKAATLFPPPPGFKRPYLTLGHDPNSRLLEDALPLLRDREVVVLRWGAPETPRSDRNVRWDVSVAADRTREEDEARQRKFKMGKEGRAAHVQRVLEEQRKIAAAEESAKKPTSEASTSTVDDEAAPQAVPQVAPEAKAVQPAIQEEVGSTGTVTELDTATSDAAIIATPDAVASDALAPESAAFDAVVSDPADWPGKLAASDLASPSPVCLEATPALEAAPASVTEPLISTSFVPAEEDASLIADATVVLSSSMDVDVVSDTASGTIASTEVADDVSSLPEAVVAAPPANEAVPVEIPAPESSPVAPDSSPSRGVLVALAKSALKAASEASGSNTTEAAPVSTQRTRTKKLVSLDHIPLLPKDKLVDFIYEEIVSLMAKVWQHSSSGFLRMDFPVTFLRAAAKTQTSPMLDWRALGNDTYVRAYGQDPSCILQKFARDFCSVWPNWAVFFAWLDANKECGWSAAEIEQFREDLKVIEPFARQCIDQSYFKVKQYVVRYLRVVDEGVNVTPRSTSARLKAVVASNSSDSPGTTSRNSKASGSATDSPADASVVAEQQCTASIADSPPSSVEEEGQPLLVANVDAQTSSQDAPHSDQDVSKLSRSAQQAAKFYSAAARESREHLQVKLGDKRKATHDEGAVVREKLQTQQASHLPSVPSKLGNASLQEALSSAQLLKRVLSDDSVPPTTPKKRRFEYSDEKETGMAAKPAEAAGIRRSTRATRAAVASCLTPLRARVRAVPAKLAIEPMRRRIIAEVIVPMCDEEDEQAVEALVSSRDSSEALFAHCSRSRSRSSSLSSATSSYGEGWCNDEEMLADNLSPLQLMRPMSKKQKTSERTEDLARSWGSSAAKRVPGAASGSGTKRI